MSTAGLIKTEKKEGKGVKGGEPAGRRQSAQEGMDRAIEQSAMTVSRGLFDGLTLPTAFVAHFGDRVGCDAGYYRYAWADTIAADMGTVFEESATVTSPPPLAAACGTRFMRLAIPAT